MPARLFLKKSRTSLHSPVQSNTQHSRARPGNLLCGSKDVLDFGKDWPDQRLRRLNGGPNLLGHPHQLSERVSSHFSR